MVRTVFSWCYGGNQVLLCGSFNGRIEQVPMILMEGSSTIFQTVCDLPPGYHKFKFLVDGAWRVDDRIHCVEDEYGIANIIFVNGTEPTTPRFVPISPQPLIEKFGASHPEASSAEHLISSDVEVCRQWLSMHLSMYKVYELIPESGKVIALDVKVTVEDAFHVMHEQRLAVVPLWDEPSGQVSGMLTASDFILILLGLQRNRALVTNELLEIHTVLAWKDIKLQLHRRPLIQAGPDESLRTVAARILEHKISAVPVLHLAQDTSCPQLLHVACLAGILKHICTHFQHHLGLPLLQQAVGNLPLGTWTREVGIAQGDRLLLILHPNDLLGSALNLLLEAQISSIPIVDDKKVLVNVFSRSDIMSLAKGNLYARIQLDHTSICQALDFVDDGSRTRFWTCHRSDSLYAVLELLSDPAVRHLVVVEAGSRKLEGVITLRDVFRFFLN